MKFNEPGKETKWRKIILNKEKLGYDICLISLTLGCDSWFQWGWLLVTFLKA